MDIATEQSAFGDCWWHPCVVDPVPALRLSVGMTGDSCPDQYQECVNTLQAASVTDHSVVNLGLYNSCYLEELTGASPSAQVYVGNTGTVTAGGPSAGAGGGPTGPASAPAPPPATPFPTTIVIGVVVALAILGALAGLLYYLFKPRPLPVLIK